MRKQIGIMLIAATLAGSGAAYAGQVRAYGQQRQDYNRWDRGEEAFYRRYLAQRRLPFIEFRRLNRWQQERYWEWRRSVRDSRDRNFRDRDDRYRGRDYRDGDRNRNWAPDRNRDRR